MTASVNVVVVPDPPISGVRSDLSPDWSTANVEFSSLQRCKEHFTHVPIVQLRHEQGLMNILTTDGTRTANCHAPTTEVTIIQYPLVSDATSAARPNYYRASQVECGRAFNQLV